MVRKSDAVAPRVVMAQLPKRTPPGEAGEVSPGRALRLRTKEIRSQRRSILEPERPTGRRSQSKRWLSVPPVTMRHPELARCSAKALQLATTSVQYWRNAGVATCRSWTASAPVVALCGPPCNAGKTALSICSRNSLRQKIIPPRGPRRLLCVVVVTTSACGKGEGCKPVATKPLMWAMSTKRKAPTSSHMLRKAAQSMRRG
mmetsp:Transcript_28217/g.63810  ORF Transcript_28217/g.63810 Transcript_28217/m.63810 type:complete len:202 (-) Transcript_28217:590-1195(-)